MSNEPQPQPPPDAATPLLTVRGLAVALGGNRILDDINLEVGRGHIHALIGPNGAGKTTLIRAIMGGMPHQGTIEFHFRGNGRIGYVPQLLEFDHSLPITVGDFFALMLQRRPAIVGQRRAVREQIRATLAETSSDNLIDRLLGGLSGGELRRVLLAQALVPVPELLLLDEPASNVDEIGAQQFEDTLLRLQSAHGITVLMVGHDLQTILRNADAVTGINHHVTFQGHPRELSDPATLGRLFGVQALSLDRNGASS